MTLFDYLAIVLSLALFNWVNNAVLTYSGHLSTLHHPNDISGTKLREFLQGLDRRFGSRWYPPFYLTAISLVAWPFLKWPALDATSVLRNFYLFLSAIVVWNAVSQPKDWYRNTNSKSEKIALFITWCAAYYYPGFFIAWLFIAIHLLRSWTSSQQMILRVLQMFIAFLATLAAIRSAALLISWGPVNIHSAAPLFLAIVVVASHYFISGWTKLQLPPQWTGWILKNQSHHLIASAYMWGWRSGQPIARRRRMIRWLGTGERLNQLFIVSVECAWLLALFDATFAMALCVASVLLHLNTFIKSGIFLWPSMLAQAALFAAIENITPDAREALFNGMNGILGAGILLAFPLRRKIWDPPRLALWDTPFIGRIDWTVEGMSGKVYALNSQCMGPYARFFGGSLPAFLIPRKIFHRFLGQVAALSLRDQVLATRGDRPKLEVLQEQFGMQEKRDDYVEAHDQFLLEYFINYNKGRKRPSRLPWWLVRAPDIYYYRSATDAPFLEQERVAKVMLMYREAYFDGEKVIEVRNELIKEIDIPLKKFQL